MRKHAIALGTVAALALLAGCDGGQGEPEAGNGEGDWEPSGIVRVAVPSAPGGGTDILARELVAFFEEARGGRGVVENYDLVEGVLAVKREPGVGEILGAGNVGTMMVRPLVQDTGYEWRDFTQLAIIGEDISFVASGAGAFDSAEAMIAETGELTVGMVGSGGINQVLMDQLSEAFDLNLRPVVFGGTGDVNRGLLTGDIDIAIMNPGDIISYVETGDLDAVLSLGSEEQTQQMPSALADVTVASELGVDQVFPSVWRIIFGAPELTDAQRDYWVTVIEDWTESPAYDEYIQSIALAPALITGDELIDYLAESEAQLTAGME